MLQHFISRMCVIAVVATAASPLQGKEGGQGLAEAPLIEILQSDSPSAEKAITCKRLAVFGSAESVPALQPLLEDPQLSSWARIALEAIPGPEADAALRETMDLVEGRLLVGVIHSIAVRGDVEAVEGLARQLRTGDAQVASAAAVALGQIAAGSAQQALVNALSDIDDETVRSAVAEGCIYCAESLMAAGQPAEARQLYDTVRASVVSDQRKREAIRGAIVARQSEGIPLLIEQLKSADQELFGLALRVSRELVGANFTKAIAGELESSSPDRQALLISALADRNDEAVLPTIMSIAKARNNQARQAALLVLGKVGDAACLPTLLAAAVESDQSVADAAMNALEILPGSSVNNDLAALLPKAQGRRRLALVELAGRRRIPAVDALVEAADDADVSLRHAALASLGATVNQDELSLLVERIASPKENGDREALAAALLEASVRMPDREACGRELATAMAGQPTEVRQAILEILGRVGGTASLNAVGAAARDADEEIMDTASRLLGQWMTADAAPVLLALAQPTADDKYSIRALRGFIRIVRQFDLPINERTQMCRAALKAASRVQEKEMIVKIAERYPNLEMLEVLLDVASEEGLRDQVAEAAMAVLGQVDELPESIEQRLAELGIEPVEIQIVKAEYGAGNDSIDVTQVLQKHAGSLPLVALPSSNYNNLFGGDPAPGVPKELRVEYTINGAPGAATFAENSSIVLPLP